MTQVDVMQIVFIVFGLLSIYASHCAYRMGVSDGAYNQWLPRVRKIIKEDSKFPPPGWEEPTP